MVYKASADPDMMHMHHQAVKEPDRDNFIAATSM
jgi:hypothetical protein